MPAIRGAWLSRCSAWRLLSFAVATGLLMGGAGAATAVADPGSRGSTGHGHSGAGTSSQNSSSVGSGTGNPAGSVAGTPRRTVQEVTSTLGSGRNPGPHASSSTTTQMVLRGTDNRAENQNAGRVAAAPNLIASVPNTVAPLTNVVASFPNPVPPIPKPVTPFTVPVPKPVASGSNVIAALKDTFTSTADPDFISNTTNFGLFTNTSAADPDDHEFVATVFSSAFFTDILTSGADPSGSLGFGQAGVGVPGETVNTLITPFFDFTFAIPVTDPFAGLFTALIPLGF
jgi:hypothetical protein